MISSTTLMLATLVFNAATVLGAPIRIPTGPAVVARAVISDPILPRVAVVDAQPVRKRSVEGNANRPRLAREIAPEVDTRDTASSESVSLRDSLPEVDEIVRRFPRRALYDLHVAKRSPEPSPTPPSDPALNARSTAPEPTRRFARRALYDRHAEPSEPAPPEARSEDPHPHFARAPELFEKRSAPTPDNFPREPEPAPAPEPVPEPAPAPQSPPEPEVKAREERRRVYPRKVLADRYEKREEPPAQTEEPPAANPLPVTPPAEPTPSPITPAPTTPAVTASGIPANLDFNKVIADAIVSGTTNTVKHTQGQKIADYRDTKITIQITQQQNSDVKLDPPSNPSSPPTSTSDPTPSGTSKPTSTSSPSPTTTPTEPGTSSPPKDSPEGSGSGTPPAGEPKPEGKGETTADPAPKPSVPAKDGAGVPDDAGSPEGEKATEPPADKRDLDSANAAAEPVTKRQLGLAGSLLASWTRRSV